MKRIFQLLDRSKKSSFRRSILNFILSRTIPFNRPHGIKISKVYEKGIRAVLPYKRVNQNHLKGLHACALATLSEFTAGTALLHCLRSGEYRIIMKDLHMIYHYQGKTEVSTELQFTEEQLQEQIFLPLKNADAVFVELALETYDADANHICTARVNWQVKKWEKVKEKI